MGSTKRNLAGEPARTPPFRPDSRPAVPLKAPAAGSPTSGREVVPTGVGAVTAARRRGGRSIRSRWLGRQLVALREVAGRQARQAAAHIERDASTLSRYESGEYAIRRTDLLALLEYYGAADQVRRELLDLRDEASQSDWWDTHPVVAGDQDLADLIWLESRATDIKEFALATVPDLLRTPAYAEEVLRGTLGEVSPEWLDEHLDLLRERRWILSGTRSPALSLSVVLAEPVVHAAARVPEQLSRLAELAERPWAEVRVLPADGLHPAADASFTVLGMPEPFPAVAHARTPAGRIFAEDAAAEPFLREFDRLYAAAMEPGPSIALLRRTTQP